MTSAASEFEKWFNVNHPLDWFAKENGGEPMDDKDRLRLHYFAKDAYLAATNATAQRCVEIRTRFGRAHTYASENADEYRAFDNAMDQYAEAIAKEFGL